MASINTIKIISLLYTGTNFLIWSSFVFILFDFTEMEIQFVKEQTAPITGNIVIGVDSSSLYFLMLTSIIISIAILSNWRSVSDSILDFLIILMVLEFLILLIFLVVSSMLFYIFFESILPPLFILICVWGSKNKLRAAYYLFIYTLFGSLFLLLGIIYINSNLDTTLYAIVAKHNYISTIQKYLFVAFFAAFAIKTPFIFVNTWLLRAHVESPLSGSIILAGIILKLSLFGVIKMILKGLSKALLSYGYIIFTIGVTTILYASLSTIRSLDIKELIAYSSVGHAAVYTLGVLSNTIKGIEGSILLGIGHGFVSPGLFICAGGVLYDRFSTRLMAFYKGMTQLMPLFAILFFILSLGNCGAPLTLNFAGEFMSLYGVFERFPLLGSFSSSSIVFSAAYTIYMYNRVSFGGVLSKFIKNTVIDLNKREFFLVLILVILTVFLGIYTPPILDGLHFSTSSLIYSYDEYSISCEGPRIWVNYYNGNSNENLDITYYLITVLTGLSSLIVLRLILRNIFIYVKPYLLNVFWRIKIYFYFFYLETIISNPFTFVFLIRLLLNITIYIYGVLSNNYYIGDLLLIFDFDININLFKELNKEDFYNFINYILNDNGYSLATASSDNINEDLYVSSSYNKIGIYCTGSNPDNSSYTENNTQQISSQSSGQDSTQTSAQTPTQSSSQTPTQSPSQTPAQSSSQTPEDGDIPYTGYENISGEPPMEDEKQYGGAAFFRIMSGGSCPHSFCSNETIQKEHFPDGVAFNCANKTVGPHPILSKNFVACIQCRASICRQCYFVKDSWVHHNVPPKNQED
jgi:NADH-ubiquinone oxidoreductase chain 4